MTSSENLHIANRNGRWTAQNAKISERGKSGRKSGKKEPRIQRPMKEGLNAGFGLLYFFSGEELSCRNAEEARKEHVGKGVSNGEINTH